MKQTIYRGKVVTYDNVIKAMEHFDKEFRDSFPEARWVTYAIEHNDRLYPPKQILRLATGGEVGGGGKPVNSRFEALGFKITMLDEESRPGQDSLDEAAETTFSLEYDLENSLVSNLEQLEKGLRLYQKNGTSGQQFDARPAGRIDILALDSKLCFVVIELKAGEADRQVCGQVQSYMGWVKENLADHGEVRGIIIASDFTDRLVYAAKVVPNLKLKKYEISFKFTDL